MSYPTTDQESEVLAASSNSQFDIKKFVFKLIGFLPWIILSVIVCYSIARLYLRYAPQMHQVAAYVLIKDEDENSSDYKVLRELGVMPGSKEVQNQIDIFESNTITSGIVDSLHLQIQIITQGRISTSPLYGDNLPVFFNVARGDTVSYRPAVYQLNVANDKFSITTGSDPVYYPYNDTFLFQGHKFFCVRNRAVKADPKGYNLIFRDTKTVSAALRAAINVQKFHEMGGIIEIAMIDEVPERAADIINKLVQAYNTAGLTDKNLVTNKTISFLKERVDTVSAELDAMEMQAEAFKRNNKVGDISEAGGTYLTKSLEADEDRAKQQGQLEILGSLEKYIRDSKHLTDIIPANNGLDEPTLGKLIDEYNTAVLELQNQSEISTERDPTLGRLKLNITELKGNILKNMQSVRQGYDERLAQIQSRYNNFDNILANLPEKEREMLGLKRQISVKEQLYLYLLQKKEETQLALASNINNTRVVDAAFDNGVIEPKASQIKTFSLLVGILIPIAVMLLLDFFNNKVQDRKEIESATHTPIVGELSYDKKNKNAIVTAKSRSVLAEQFRLVRTNLHYMGGDKPIKTILVTSFMSGEGKSFISINLASNLSIGGAKVLLLELDLRKPKFSKYLRLNPTYGVTDYIVNNINYKEAVQKMPGNENVHIISSGPVPPNPTELLISKRLENLFKEVQQDYDFVVVDTSPVGLVADAFSLDKYAEVTLFILRHKFSFKTTLTYIERLYSEKRFKNLGIVVNGISDPQGIGYGYGYSYGYGYGYGYSYGYHYGSGYYGSSNEPRNILSKIFSLFRR